MRTASTEEFCLGSTPGMKYWWLGLRDEWQVDGLSRNELCPYTLGLLLRKQVLSHSQVIEALQGLRCSVRTALRLWISTSSGHFPLLNLGVDTVLQGSLVARSLQRGLKSTMHQ